jgi:quinolinate synthase
MNSILNAAPRSDLIEIKSDMAICQTDYPLGHYQENFIPYAEEYLALKDRKLTTILNWMTPYVKRAQEHFGDALMLVAHYYMGGEIVKLIEQFDGEIGDSYQLALKALNKPEKTIIIESAVHFMAESISILANPNQTTYITNPRSGCTMEMLAKDYMVEPALNALNERYGEKNMLPICYMNTSGRVKALTGAQGGAVCTSSNVKKIFEWALAQNKKILFIPDKHMGENVAHWLSIPASKIAYWPGGSQSSQFNLDLQSIETIKRFDEASLVLFESFCAVHTHYNQAMNAYWQAKGYATVAHPECRNEVIRQADYHGSTSDIWKIVMNDHANTRRYAIATENHMVQNLKEQARLRGIEVENLADANIEQKSSIGCGCATMSRNDPPHLVALLDLLRKGELCCENIVKPGDVVNEFSGLRERLTDAEKEELVFNAKRALQKMIEITER